MSSCFTVDLSCTNADSFILICNFSQVQAPSYMLRKHMTILAGSGALQDSTMHTGVGHFNYVSYYVRRIQFKAEFSLRGLPYAVFSPAYAVLFKFPYKVPPFDDIFTNIKDFILYKEPEKILGYDITSVMIHQPAGGNFTKDGCHFSINVTKPFIVGPNDYVGVFYFIPVDSNTTLKLGGSAKVWFDPV